MKQLSLQWRITLLTALLIACACVCMNLLLYRTGVTGMRIVDAYEKFEAATRDKLRATSKGTAISSEKKII